MRNSNGLPCAAAHAAFCASVSSGKTFLAKHGDTDERLVANGWFVARIAASAFVSRDFQASVADNARHCDAAGKMALFKTSRDQSALELAFTLVDKYTETPQRVREAN